ncbi:MAG TPA: hypothetical protein VFR34_08755, partial [Paracoccaceae bacterium]|nr:hypothetical protein [Paracoccaceae bacterium]
MSAAWRDALDQASALFAWAPDGLVSTLVFAAALLLAFALHRLLIRQLEHAVSDQNLFWRSLLGRGRRLLLMALLLIALVIAADLAPLAGRGAGLVQHILS